MSYLVVVKNPKNKGIAILLVILFGPLGLLYSTIIGGLIMTFIYGIFLILVSIGVLSGIGILLLGDIHSLLIIFISVVMYWLLCIIWALNAVDNYNDRILKEARMAELNYEKHFTKYSTSIYYYK